MRSSHTCEEPEPAEASKRGSEGRKRETHRAEGAEEPEVGEASQAAELSGDKREDITVDDLINDLGFGR